MTVKGIRGTWAMRAEARPEVAPTYTQAELRDRRRKGLIVVLGGDWMLHEDVAAIVGPLAQQIADAPHSARFLRTQADRGGSHLAGPRQSPASIDDLALAVHGVVHAVVGLLHEADAEHRTRHLSGDQRARARASLRTLAERPVMPELDKTDASKGTWAPRLVDLAKPYSEPLARLLGNALGDTVSARLVKELRDVDAAAGSLQRRLDRDAAMRAEARSTPTISEADRARAELESLGVSL